MTELTRQPGKYVDLAIGGTAVHLTRHGRVVAALLPAEDRGGAVTTRATISDSVAPEVQATAPDASAASRRPAAKTTPMTAQQRRDQLLRDSRKR